MTVEAFTAAFHAFCKKNNVPWDQHIARIEAAGAYFRVYYSEPKPPMGDILPYADYSIKADGEIVTMPK